MTSPILGLPEWEQGQSQPNVPMTEAIRGVEAVAQITVLSVGENSPPMNPVNGDCHIAGIDPIGFWTGGRNKLLLFNNGWKFFAPREGWRATNSVNGYSYEFKSGKWVHTTYPEDNILTGNYEVLTNHLGNILTRS